MEDAIKVISAKFKLSAEVLNNVSTDNESIGSWITVLGAYVIDNDRKQEEQKTNENLLRKQRLNAEHQLNQLEKQLISCNGKLTKYEKNLLDVKTKLDQKEESFVELEKKYELTHEENKSVKDEIAQLNQKYSHLKDEKVDFSQVLEQKSKEIDRLTQEWNDISKRLTEANKSRYQLQYELDEIKNSDIRKEFKEKRLEQEKSMLVQQVAQFKKEIGEKTSLALEFRKDNMGKVIDLETKIGFIKEENIQLKKILEASKKTCKEQEGKITDLLSKMKRASEEHIEQENNMQQELTSQNKLVELYKEDRDHAKQKLEEVMTAVSELQNLVKESGEEKLILRGKLQTEEEQNSKKIEELETLIKKQTAELENANDLLQLSRKRGSNLVPDESLSDISPMAAASSAILKKGMTLTQIYTEYVKVTDELTTEKDENSRLKLYMEQILNEVEEKAPLLMKQKEDYEHANRIIENMAIKLENNIKECHRMKTEHGELERSVNFHKREEKRLRTLCVDLSQQVRVLLKEVEEARGGVVSSSGDLPELMSAGDSNKSSADAVISEHLVTFKSIEELQAQNERLLLTVRQLSEEQEKLEQEGGPEIIQELKKKIETAKVDLITLQENQKTQDQMMQQLARQRDMYKVLCNKGGVMVGDISSTSNIDTEMVDDYKSELAKTKAQLNRTLGDHLKWKEEILNKEQKLQETTSKQEEQISSLKLEYDRLKNKCNFTEEKYAILQTTSEGYQKETKALEEKCKSINQAYSNTRIEAEKCKEDYNEAKEKLLTAMVSIKTFETEKNLLKESEKRLMQENQSLLEQQRSQNVLLTNLQTIQNNLERQEFETRKSLSKQVEGVQREMRALRRNSENESSQLKITKSSMEKEVRDLNVKLGITEITHKTTVAELESSKQQLTNLDAKCKELEALSKASENRLTSILEGDVTAKAQDASHHELERYKTRVRELEVELSSAINNKKAIEDQLDVTKKHLEQFKEIGNTNEQAINDLTKANEVRDGEFKKKLEELTNQVKNYKTQITSVVAEKLQLKRSKEAMEKSLQAKIAEIRQQSMPLERRYQEVTRALVNAKELETAAKKESQEQCKIATAAQDKYERELLLHAKDVEQLTLLKEESKVFRDRHESTNAQLSELRLTKSNNDKLTDQIKHHHQNELRKGEQVRKDLISQNSILHGQVEKLSAQLAQAKTQNRKADDQESSPDKSVEEVYELLRFVRREKEIAETKAEASETESMRYRQRAEHLQRDLEETKQTLELEFERTKGLMLTKDEHKEIMEKIKKCKELEVLNKELEKHKGADSAKLKCLNEKIKKQEDDIKPLQESKKALENEKNTWLAEKTALKSEIERWTARTNQLMAQSAKTESDEVKKLQLMKVQSEKLTAALQEDVKRTKQQMEVFKRESLKLKSENSENLTKLNALQAEVTDGGQQQKEVAEIKKQLEDKNKIVQQLKKLAKKYKTMSDKQQKLLDENKIDSSSATAVGGENNAEGGTVQPSQVSADEKKKLEAEIEQKLQLINVITGKLSSLQNELELERKSHNEAKEKLDKRQAENVEAEQKLVQEQKQTEKLRAELNDEKDKNEKKQKFLKTAKDKIASLTKQKDGSQQEVEALKKQLSSLNVDQSKSTAGNADQSAPSIDQATLDQLKQLNAQLIQSKQLIEQLTNEKNLLTSQIEQLKSDLGKAIEEKKNAENSLKAANYHYQQQQQHKVRTQSVSKLSTETTAAVEPIGGNTPLTATVRPTATPSSSQSAKVYPQSTPTASIRPIAHTAPTAMISPTLSTSQSSGVAEVMVPTSTTTGPITIHPFTHPQQPQMVEVQGRVRAQVQPQEVHEQTAPDSQTAAEPSSSSSSTSQVADDGRPSNKRQRVEEADEQTESSLEETDAGEEPGNKRQKTQTTDTQEILASIETDSQEGHMEEDELLAEAGDEEGDDDVIEPAETAQDNLPVQTVESRAREQRLQNERSLIPSPQELIRQQRTQIRGRYQLPSFSLPSHAGGAYYDESADDSTVPSTPTLSMPKRTDGFAEAVSSPVVRFPTFSFSSNDQPSSSQTPALGQSGELMQQTRMDLLGTDEPASVPQTPLSVVPSGILAPVVINTQSSDRGQEQNVPQQIDLTEEEDEEEDEPADVEEDINENEAGNDMVGEEEEEEGVDDVESNMNYQLEEEAVEETNDQVELFAHASDIDHEEQDLGDVDGDEEESGEDQSDQSETSTSSSEEEDEEVDDADDRDVQVEEEIVEIPDDDDEEEEEEEDLVDVRDNEDEGDDGVNDEKGDDDGSEMKEEKEAQQIPTEEEGSESSQTTQQDQSRPKPVRLQRTTGVRPRIRRDHLQGRLQKPESNEK